MHADSAKVQPLDDLLAQVSRLHHHRAHESLDILGLYRGQPPVLFALWDQDGLPHSELVEKLGITPATVTRMIQRMEKTGFVRREPDANDQRISRVFLTEAGRAVHAKLQSIRDRMEVENFARFSDEEKVLLRSFLLRIRENLTRATDVKVAL
jgi:MarR family transcriptional regulator, organic hydroperoxide resistance regulator